MQQKSGKHIKTHQKRLLTFFGSYLLTTQKKIKDKNFFRNGIDNDLLYLVEYKTE